MVVSQQNTLPPTRLPLPPRRVFGGPGGEAWVARGFAILLLAVMLFFAGGFIGTYLVIGCGTDVVARVTGGHTTNGRHRHNYVRYEYPVDGRLRQDHDEVRHETYERLIQDGRPARPDQTISIRHFRLGGWVSSGIPGEAGERLAHVTLVLDVFLLFPLFLMARVGWVSPARVRWLCRFGEVAVGTIIARDSEEYRGVTRYTFTYRFRLPSSKRMTGATTTSDTAIGDRLAKGGFVTVLFRPDKPHQNLVYELQACRVEGAAMTVAPTAL